MQSLALFVIVAHGIKRVQALRDFSRPGLDLIDSHREGSACGVD
jgi:hypothetical protein